jgi:hypothetical protein
MTDVAERIRLLPPETTTGWIEFDIHGRVGLRVERDAPAATQLVDMLAPFRADGLARHDITITGSVTPLLEASHAEHEYRYTDSSLYLMRPKVQIDVQGDGYSLHGTRELLTFLLPLIDYVMVRRDVAMIHAATVDFRGIGVALPAWGGVGKTSTIAKLLRLDGVGFMGDDWAFASGDQQLLGYFKPMFIKPHHQPIYPHLFEQNRKPLVPRSLSKHVADLTTIAHPVVTRYPKLAGISRRWSPEHIMVTPQQALPHATFTRSVPLKIAIFVERFDGDGPLLEPVEENWMVSRLLGNFHSELPADSRDVITAMAATGLAPLHEVFAEKAAVLRRAISGLPCYCLRVPAAMSADTASDAIVAHLRTALANTGLE